MTASDHDISGPLDSHPPGDQDRSRPSESIRDPATAISNRVMERLFGEPPRDERSFGRYTMLHRIGQGGMGSVYAAFDPTLDRRVAIKVLHRDLEQRHTRRLWREAQAMAKLSHPNVVQVYEVDEVDDQTYVAMELVEGQTIQQWLQQRPPPSWKACVDVFIQLGRGLAAAHTQGLVHRDFKPGNGIIDEEGRARVLDFGLARRHDDSSSSSSEQRPNSQTGDASSSLNIQLTRTGAIMGTPRYMALEQIRHGEADARSDQFSFCVALYEATYGQPPFEGTTLIALAQAIIDGPGLPPPGQPGVPRGLHRILLRGLAAQPEDRWPSMEALLGELHGLITPRARRWVLATSMAGFVLVGGGLAVGPYVQTMQRCTDARSRLEGIWDGSRREDVEAALLDTGLPHAAETWARVKSRLDDHAQAWVEHHTEVCEATVVRQEQSEASMELRMDCLHEQRGILRARVDLLAEADASLVDEAVVLVAGLPDLARCDDTDRLRRQRERMPPPEDPRLAHDVEQLRERLQAIEAEHDAGRYAQALEHLDPLLADSGTLAYGPVHAEALLLRGLLLAQDGQYPEAERELTRAHGLAVRHAHESVELKTSDRLGYVVGYLQARFAEGKQWSRTALPLAERLGDPGAIASVMGHLATVHYRQGEYDDAERLLRRTLELRERALGADHPTIAGTANNLGNILAGQGRFEEAQQQLQRAVEVYERALGSSHPNVASSLANLGNVLDSQGKYEDAERAHRRALELEMAALGEDHPDVARSLNNLALVLGSRGEHEDAERLYRQALTIRERHLGLEHPDVATTAFNLAHALINKGEPDVAENYFRRALVIWESGLGADHPDVGLASSGLAKALFERGRLDDAAHLYRRALEIVQRSQGNDHPDSAHALDGLAKIALAQQRGEVAREHANRIIELRQAAGIAPDMVADGQFLLARALDPEELARARTLAQQARNAYAEHGAGREQSLAQVDAWLAAHPLP